MNVSKLFNNIFVKNILLAIIVFLLLVFIVLRWLDAYTNHGEQVAVPDVKGLQLLEAASFFNQRELKYEVIDSSFVKNKLPGSILETVPPVGTNVKKGRTIYITINAYTAQLLVIPAVKDMSQRQALSILRSIGFESIETKVVPGTYKDLVLGLETQGKLLEAGDRVPANAVLNLLVSSGSAGYVFPDEEIVIDSTEAEESLY